ncbi:hypothetical protein [Chryseobacterium sp. Leaf405]|nr:hypothetical protein [Chryseobacterium sp. Leaf405]
MNKQESTTKPTSIADQENVRLIIFGHDSEQWPQLKKAPEYYS